ncbi:hypothetical protein C7S15_7014 [Burkholderia cepacia]|nr:hypothetical protein [Burkholderia cepacia]
MGAAMTEMLMLKRTLPNANTERPRPSPLAVASPATPASPAPPAQSRIVQKSDMHADIVSRIFPNNTD